MNGFDISILQSIRTIFLTLSLIIFGTFSSSAQDSSLVAYEIVTDTIKLNRIDPSFWLVLEDESGNWTIDDILKQPLSEKFHKKGLKAEGIDTNDIRTYWMKYRLKNGMKQTAKVSLSSNVDYYDVYLIRENNPPQHFKSGFLRPFEERDGLKSVSGGFRSPGWAGAIPLSLDPGEEVLIIDRRSKKNTGNYGTSVRLLSTEKLIQEEYIDYVDSRSNYFGKMHLQEAFIVGLLLLTVFLNLFFYKIVLEKEYLYFALFCLFLAINRMYNILWEFSSWEHPALIQNVRYIGFAWAIIPYFLIQFFRYYLNIRAFYPRWDKMLLALGILNIIAHVSQFLAYYFNLPVANILNKYVSVLPIPVIPVFLIITLILFSFRKEKAVWYLIIGSLPLLIFYAYNGIRMLFGSPVMENFRLAEIISICWFVFFFAVVLLLRFDLLRSQHNEQVLKNERLAREKEMEKNALIERQKSELEIQVAERTASLSESIRELKATQAQLIQSEKMASLGELTAGIAHEIQNPLNFVNNFSEVNKDLLDEVKSQKSKVKNVELDDLIEDIFQNNDKILHHGKRADAIVKGMLQHSQKSSGTKEPTNINALADEYLRLAYHGLRAKDNSFNATIKTEFDQSIGNVNIIPQEIGRVLLNLINNAFYAVNEKKRQIGSGYEPEVIVSTKLSSAKSLLNHQSEIRNPESGIIQSANSLVISVKDNGNGIPDTIKEKIFQPFFTTKPTGQGTGLGLSLSYDIVKAHGGELKMETKEGQGSEFSINLQP